MYHKVEYKPLTVVERQFQSSHKFIIFDLLAFSPQGPIDSLRLHFLGIVIIPYSWFTLGLPLNWVPIMKLSLSTPSTL